MATSEGSPLGRARDALHRSVDVASLAVYRVLFGSLIATSSLRFLLEGWVDERYVKPRFFFKYWGFEWVEVLPAPVMEAAFVALSVLGVLIALGLFFRPAIIAFFLLFTYVELIDVTTYLNHYYLVSLLALLMIGLPMNRGLSLDARLFGRRFPALRSMTVPAWALYVLRFQVGIVYFYAAMAKVGPDWMLHGQPLNIWLSSRGDTPLLGPLLQIPAFAYVAGWAGFLNDLLAPFLLSHRKTRPFGFVMVVGFHLATHLLFNIGIFPFLMIFNATLFFDPSWPRKLLRLPIPSARSVDVAVPSGLRRALGGLGGALLVLHCVVQVTLPLRTHLYGGDVLWHEQGMRFSWRVMLRKKDGSVTYRVRHADSPRELHVPPHRYLTPAQEQEMSSQPDLILALGHWIAEDFRLRGYRDVEVRVDALASLNGRRAARLIDPDVDLAATPDGLAKATYILPPPGGDPAWLRAPSPSPLARLLDR